MDEQDVNFQMLAKTFAGLEDVLAQELLELGAQDIKPGVRNVAFKGDLGFMYKANYCLRTALRIFKPIATFKVRNEKELYRKLYDMEWESIIAKGQTIAVDGYAHSRVFRNSHYIELRTKDAIVDRLREEHGWRPSVDKDDPDVLIQIHINRENVTVSLDSSGQPLFKRGYRSSNVTAPINEVLAAGLLRLSLWKAQSHLVDPMCGSGTFLIEGAMYALNIPAQINRDSFGFMNWPDFDEALYKMIVAGREQRMKDTYMTFTGYDLKPYSVKAARDSVERAGLEEFIKIEQKDFFKTEKHINPVTLIFNPPYGERLNRPEDFYQRIGDTLKHNYPGATAWLITSDIDGLKSVGLRTSRRIAVKNGKLDCKFVQYELYEGSKKQR